MLSGIVASQLWGLQVHPWSLAFWGFPSPSQKHAVGVPPTLMNPRRECGVLQWRPAGQSGYWRWMNDEMSTVGYLSCWKQLEVVSMRVWKERPYLLCRRTFCMFSKLPAQVLVMCWDDPMPSEAGGVLGWHQGRNFAVHILLILEGFCQITALKLVIVTECNWCLL